jgi:hypothetical protein
VANPEELWRIGDKVRCCNWGGYIQGDEGDFSLFSWEAYRGFRTHTPEFADLAELQAGNAPLAVRKAGSQAQADTRNGDYVSGNFFRTFGVERWIGRLMTDADDQEGAPPAAVMSSTSGRNITAPIHQSLVRATRSMGIHYRDRRISAGILWSQAGRLGNARFLGSSSLLVNHDWYFS